MSTAAGALFATPRVGVGVIVLREGLVLLGQRIGAHGTGTWALPGGHLEFGESVEQCARREVLEEAGLDVEPIGRGPYTSDVFDEQRHYVTLFVLARTTHGEAQRCEPHKCARWQWCRWSEMPAPLFAPLQTLRSSGYVPPGAR